jgi:hypothetical protein
MAGRELKESTIKEYEKKIKKLNENVDDFYEDPMEILNWLDSSGFSGSTQKSYLSAVKWEMGADAFPDFLQERLNELYGQQNDRAKSQLMTTKQEEQMVEWSVVKKKAEEYIEKYKDTGVESKYGGSSVDIDYPAKVLIAGLYTLQPPVRADYGDMIVSIDAHKEGYDGNELVFRDRGNSYFLFRKYKTSKTYGEARIPVSPELYDLIKHLGKEKGKYLFTNHGTRKQIGQDLSNEPLGNKLFAQEVQNVFGSILGKVFGINMLRHSYIMYHFPKLTTIAKKEELAKMMLHSRLTQETYNLVGEAD